MGLSMIHDTLDFMSAGTKDQNKEFIESIKQLFISGKIGEQSAKRRLAAYGVKSSMIIVDEWFVEKHGGKK